MSKNEDSETLVANTEPKGTMELLIPPIPLKNDGGVKQERVLGSNEDKQEKVQFELTQNFSNKDSITTSWVNQVENKEKMFSDENALKNRKEEEQINLSKGEHLINKDSKLITLPETKKENWVEQMESKRNNFHGNPDIKNNIEPQAINSDKHLDIEKSKMTEKVEGHKKAFNEDNNKAKGKSLYEINPASNTSLNEKNAKTIPQVPRQSFVDLVKGSVIKSTTNTLKNEIKKEEPKISNKEIKQATDGPKSANKQEQPSIPRQSFVEMVKSNPKTPSPPSPPSRGPKR